VAPAVHAVVAPPRGQLSIVAGTGSAGKARPGPAARSPLNAPFRTAVDGRGDVYIADTGNNEIEKVTPGRILSIIAGTGKAGTATPGPATRSELNFPAGVAVDGRGDVYIADTGNNEIERVTPQGILSIIAGTGAPGPALTGPATRSPLHYPYAVAVGASDNLYVADAGNNEIETVSPAGLLSIVAGTGAAGDARPGPAKGSDLDFPTGVAVDGRGDVYIADTFNVIIEKVAPDGILSVIAGTGTAGTAKPGKATHSDLKFPYGVGVDGVGTVYIADTFNSMVERVSRTGILSIVAGTGVVGTIKPGKAIRSPLGHPTGVTVSPGGNLYLADEQADDVMKITASKTKA
jgi:sugar lactone lactonase YvrE